MVAGGGMCGFLGGHAWLGGTCGWQGGGMHGWQVGHAWFPRGACMVGMGACMVSWGGEACMPGGMHGEGGYVCLGWHVW